MALSISSPSSASPSPANLPDTANHSTTPLGAVLALTFLESFGTVLLERAVYFYTRDVLHFGETENLWLAFAFGGFYSLGAIASHSIATRTGEKRLLSALLVALLALHTGLAIGTHAWVLSLSLPVIGFLQGAKWPLVESFMSAGRTPTELTRALSRYNMSWSLAVPLALAGSGPLIASGKPALLFVAAALLNLTAMLIMPRFAARPKHLAETHPERPQAAETARMASLLASARWIMLLSYALLFLLAPLMPEVLARLDLAVSLATPVAALLDVARVSAFALLGAWIGWRGRIAPLGAAIVILPLAFALTLFGGHLSAVIAGEIAFGLASGLAYTSSLYYALVLKNASVDAGGAHEGLIGAGFALGPLAGLFAHAATAPLGGYVSAMLAGVLPVIATFTILAARPLRRAARASRG